MLFLIDIRRIDVLFEKFYQRNVLFASTTIHRDTTRHLSCKGSATNFEGGGGVNALEGMGGQYSKNTKI